MSHVVSGAKRRTKKEVVGGFMGLRGMHVGGMRWIVACVFMVMMIGCGDSDMSSQVTSDFESGGIGAVYRSGPNEWELSLADDNNNPELPDRWRCWWYIRIDDVDPLAPVVLHLNNRGWGYYYTPVYSYDQKHWHRFTEAEVSQPGEFELRMKKQFTSSTVWIARFYPYTYSDLTSYLASFDGNPHVEIETPATTQNGHPIYFLTLSDFNVDDSGKTRVWMHARTHPGETGPSFLLEGLINFLLSGTHEADEVLSRFVFHIVPMQNIDGVMAGNYRTTPKSENLEVMWYVNPETPFPLTADAPLEVEALHEIIAGLMARDPAISLALNLHASNSEPDLKPFFYPHFGSKVDGYTGEQASLWDKQIRFMNSVGRHYGYTMLEPAPPSGGSSFAKKTYPESWWWRNYQDEVMAITMETTYGRAGYSPEWITPDDLRSLGEAVALGLRDYVDPAVTFEKNTTFFKGIGGAVPMEPHGFYPPNDPNEMKE